MGHVGKEVALGLVRCVSRGLLELEDLSFIFPLLLSRLHLLHARVDLALMSVADDVEDRYQRENEQSDEDAYDQYIPGILHESALFDDYRKMPLVVDRVNKDRALLSVDHHLEVTLVGTHYLLIDLLLVRILAVVLTLLSAVMMGNYRTIVVKDKSISVAVDLDPFHSFLNVIKSKVQAKDVIGICKGLTN